MSAPLPSDPEQERVLNFTLNNFMVSSLLLGIYTVVYFSTLYICSTRKVSQNRVVMGTISLSYVIYMIESSVQWYNAKQAFVSKGATREATFAALYRSPTEWAFFIRDVCYFFLAALADCLLIWRCFNVWNRSFYAILIPVFFLCCEAGMALSLIVIACVYDLKSGPARILNALFGVGTFMTLAATLSATFLISYRIHTFSKEGPPRGSKARVKHLVEMLIQSAAIYSVVALTAAIASVIPFTDSNSAPLTAAQGYTVIHGIGPTIMVARVVVAQETNSISPVVTQMSSLQFQNQSTISTGTQTRRNAIRTAGNNRSLVGEAEFLPAAQRA